MTKERMPAQIDKTNWTSYASAAVHRKQWSVVIAAAGKGSRLGFDLPKILFPVAGRTILDWLLDLLLPYCETVVAVVSPDGRAVIESELERRAPGRYKIAVQQVPTGMGDAVDIGAAEVTTPHTAVIWGDQVAIQPASVEAIIRLHQGPLNPALTIPMVIRPMPYIHFERKNGRIERLLQAREGDRMPETGESDTGLFCFQTDTLRELLGKLKGTPEAMGSKTAEFNLLPVIPYASRNGYEILTPYIMEIEETVGINSAADAGRIEPFLRERFHV